MFRVLLVLAVLSVVPNAAWACSCVYGQTPVVDVDGRGTPPPPAVPDQPPPPALTYVPGQPISIPADWRGVYATGKVVGIRPLPRSGMKEVVIQVTEGLINADTGTTITVYTAANEAACGYPFVQWRDYVIESHFLASANDPWFAGVPRSRQQVIYCGRTRELNTPEGNQVLSGIWDALRRR